MVFLENPYVRISPSYSVFRSSGLINFPKRTKVVLYTYRESLFDGWRGPIEPDPTNRSYFNMSAPSIYFVPTIDLTVEARFRRG